MTIQAHTTHCTGFKLRNSVEFAITRMGKSVYTAPVKVFPGEEDQWPATCYYVDKQVLQQLQHFVFCSDDKVWFEFGYMREDGTDFRVFETGTEGIFKTYVMGLRVFSDVSHTNYRERIFPVFVDPRPGLYAVTSTCRPGERFSRKAVTLVHTSPIKHVYGPIEFHQPFTMPPLSPLQKFRQTQYASLSVPSQHQKSCKGFITERNQTYVMDAKCQIYAQGSQTPHVAMYIDPALMERYSKVQAQRKTLRFGYVHEDEYGLSEPLTQAPMAVPEGYKPVVQVWKHSAFGLYPTGDNIPAVLNPEKGLVALCLNFDVPRNPTFYIDPSPIAEILYAH